MKRPGFLQKSRLTYRTVIIVSVFVVFSLIWISSTDRILGWLVQDPRLMTTLATYKGFVYILICALLLAGMISSTEPSEGPAAPGSSTLTRRELISLLGAFLLAASVVVVSAIGVYQFQKHELELKAQDDLEYFANSQKDQLERWLGEHLRGAEAATRDPMLSTALSEGGAGTGKGRARMGERLQWLKTVYGYQSVALLEPSGRTVVSTDPESPTRAESQAVRDLAASPAHRLAWNLEAVPGASRVHASCVVPVRGGPEGPLLGVLLLSFEFDRVLVPLLQAQSAFRPSSETDLIHQEGDQLLHLSRTSLSAIRVESLSMASAEQVDVQAVRSAGGRFRGLDHRGVAVFATSRKLEHLPWILIVKMAQAEVTAPLTRLAWIYGAFSVLVLLLLGSMLYAWWSRNRIHSMAIQERIEREKNLLVARFQSLSQHANDIVLLLDETGRILDVNDRALSAYSYTREQMLSLHVKDLRSLEQGGGFRAQFEAVMRERSIRFETVHVRKDGSFFPVEVSSRVFEQDGRLLIQSILRDISERKRAEEVLRNSERRFRIVADYTYDWEFWSDESGLLLYSSPSCVRVTGFAPEELPTTKSLLGIVLPEDHSLLQAHLDEAHREAKSGEIVFRIRRKDGSTRWIAHVCQPILESGMFLGTRASNRDVTDQVQAREWLRESEERLRRIIEATRVGTWEWEIPTGETQFNERWAEIIGYTLQELAPVSIETWRSHAHPEDLQRSEELLKRHFEGKEPYYDMECRIRHRDGHWAWVHDRGKVTEWSMDGHPLRMSGTHTDITARKRAEEALRQEEERYHAILRTSLDAFILLDEEARFVEVNEAYCQMTGYTLSELRSMRVPDIEILETQVDISAKLDRLMRGERFRFESRHRSKSGQAIDLEVSAQAHDHRIFAFLRDITERKRAEAALRASEKRYQSLFWAIQEGFALHEIITDDSGSPRDYRILDINPAFEAMTGITKAEWAGRTLMEFSPSAEISWIQKCGYVALTGEAIRFEHHFGATGRWFQVHAFSPEPRQFAFLIFDITERKRAEKSLQGQIRFLHTLINTIPLPIFAKDLEGRYTIGNEAFSNFLGIPPPDLLGKTVYEISGPARSSLYADQDRRLFEAPGAQVYQAQAQAADGSLRELVFHKATYDDADGNLAGIVGVIIDITERQNAENALRHSEAQFRSLVESAPDPIFIQTEGRFRYANPALLNLLGASSPEDILGMPVMERIHPEDRDITRQRIQALNIRKEKQAPREVHFLKLDGSSVFIEITGVPFRYNEQDGALVLDRDVTERKQAEREITSKTELLNLTGHMAKVGGWEFDARTLQGTWTDEVAVIHDLDPSDPTSVSLGITFYPQEDRKRLEAAIQAAIQTALPYDLELAFTSAKGVPKIVHTLGYPVTDPEGQVIQVRGIFQDVTEQRQAEAAVREGRAKLEAALSSMQDALFISDAEGRFVHMNDAFATFHRFKDKSQCLETLAEYPDILNVSFPNGEPAPLDQWAVSRALRGEIRTNEEYHLERRDTGERWVGSYSFGPIRDAQGTIVGSVVAGRDITELKQAEDRIRRLNEELELRVKERTAQLEAANQELEAFSYSVSHDLRAPLRGIDGFSRALLDDYRDKLDSQGQHYLDRVRVGAQRMGLLIDDLLKLSRISRDELDRRPVDLSALACRILSELAQREPEHRVRSEIEPGAVAFADPRLMSIALENLLSNAWKFTRKAADPCITFGVEVKGGESVFFVRDNGAGFDMAYAPKLFNAFQRLHSAAEFEGTGIGLAIVQRIIHRHGGRIWAEAAVDQGARFRFTLPSRSGG